MFETSQIGSTTSYNTLENIASQSMGKDEFLKLLVEQLKNQDPLSPMESQEFASQLAQFSQVELLTSVDANLQDGINIDMLMTQTINNTMATTFIGKEVTAYGDNIHLSGEESTSVNFILDGSADEVTIEIRDEAGVVVKTISAKSMSSGEQSVEWDGKDDEGGELAEGNYTFNVEATDVDGNVIDATELTKGLVSAVRYVNGSAILVIDDREILFSDVMQIGQGS